MQRVFLTVLSLLLGVVVQAQESPEAAPSLVFECEVWDFGRIAEVDGKVSHAFEFTNTADHPVQIERVYSSCGCTTGDYPRRPLKSGDKAQFTITFDPDGRPGRFDKRITVVYDQGRGRTILRVKGVVKAAKQNISELYPRSLGAGVRADATYKAFGNVALHSTRSMTIALVNTSERGVSIEPQWVERSGALELFLPDTLAPGEKALATATYALLNENARYGLLRDRVQLLIDGTPSGEEIVTTVIGVDAVDKRAAKKAKATFEPAYHDFGDVQPPMELSHTFRLTNGGTAPLVVRKVTPREGTTLSLTEGLTIGVGESVEFSVSLSVPSGSYDTIFGGAMVVTNDADRPVRELRLSANVKYK